MNLNFGTDHKIVVVSPGVAAGTTNITPGGVDTAGYDSVLFLAVFGTLSAGAVTSLKAQASNDNGNTDAWSDIAGSNTPVPQATGSNKAASLDVYRPIKRYVQPVVLRGTGNAVLQVLVAVLYNAAHISEPVVADASVVASNFLPDGTPLGAA
jgi:hypothetical protein